MRIIINFNFEDAKLTNIPLWIQQTKYKYCNLLFFVLLQPLHHTCVNAIIINLHVF